MLKPKPVGGHKIQTYWTGPAIIESRTGASSFEVSTANGETRAVHISQIKPYHDDVLEGGVPLHFYRSGNREAPYGDPEVQEILSHRIEDTGLPQFLVRWSESSPSQDTWLSLLDMIELKCSLWAPYCSAQGISTVTLGALAAAMAAGPMC